jgi:hypothetical protein
MPHRFGLYLSFIAALAVPCSAAAAWTWKVPGAYRLRLNSQSDIPLDEHTTLGQTQWAEHRLRIEPHAESFELSFDAQLDLLSGMVWGDESTFFDRYPYVPRSLLDRPRDDAGAGFRPSALLLRRLYITWRLPWAQIQAGLMGSQWGLGLMASDGNGEDNVDFGDKRWGDNVWRVLFATRPLYILSEGRIDEDLVTALGADIVWRDDAARAFKGDFFESAGASGSNPGLQAGDFAAQFVAAVRHKRGPVESGLYIALRHQEFADSAGPLTVAAFDLFLRYDRTFDWLHLVAEGEGAYIRGGTTYVRNIAHPEGVSVEQLGGAGRIRGAIGIVEAEVELGYASGDDNPYDGVIRNFKFDRDFRVGTLMFDEVIAWQSAGSAAQLMNPDLSGRPPYGADLLPSQGAVTNAVYVKRILRLRPPGERGLKITLQQLDAWAAESPRDAYRSYLNGGGSLNAFGGVPGHGYGAEFDGSITYFLPLRPDPDGVRLEAGVQLAAFFPGDAFALPGGGVMAPVYGMQARATFTW